MICLNICKSELGVKLYALALKKLNFIVMSVRLIEVKPKIVICIHNHTFTLPVPSPPLLYFFILNPEANLNSLALKYYSFAPFLKN